jgi:hypothetical protein
MKLFSDPALLYLLGGTLGLLIFASVMGWVLAKRATSDSARLTVANLNARTKAWWGMVAVFAGALAVGPMGATIMFGLTSFMALREFITLTPTKPGDHRTLFWVFFIITPLHYYFLATRWYGMFVIVIPVYAFLLVPLRTAMAGDCERFLGPDGLRLLHQLRTRDSPPAQNPRLRRPERQAAVLVRHRRGDERRDAVRVGQNLWQTQDRPHRQPRQNMGGLARRRCHNRGPRSRAVVGHPVFFHVVRYVFDA